MDLEAERYGRKVEAGAEFFFSQPVFDPELLDRFLEKTEAWSDVPFMVGIMPLVSARNAEFLHNEVPGMSIPKEIREKMQKVGKGPQARQMGVSIAQESLLSVADRVAGAYIMPPFGRYSAALDILSVVVLTKHMPAKSLSVVVP